MILIVGGGISGLAIGWRLAQTGRQVTIFERDRAGHAASWAAAGMLAANAEAEPGEEALLPLLHRSQKLWPAFARELHDETGIDVGYRSDGTLVVALDRDDGARLQFLFDYQKSLGLPVEWVTGREARTMEPHLARAVLCGVWSPFDHQVDNRLATAALSRAFRKAGGVLRENTPVDRVIVENGRATALVAGGDTVQGDAIVLAAGAWSRNLAGLPDDARPPVRPVKGQMIALEMDPTAALIHRVVWTPRVYLVPRHNGRLLIGATVEEMDFDTTMTAGGLHDLLRYAWEVLPAIYDLPVAETWAGLRPTSRDDAPILGPGPVAGLLYATGHHRNGILLAPVTADVLTRTVIDGRLPPEAAAFTLDRFAA